MSDFKFACPVCGQHITADSRTSGKQIECPTCFQRIVVPQAPESGDSKLLLSASLAGKPRPIGTEVISERKPHRHVVLESVLATSGLLIVLGIAGATAFHYREEIIDSLRSLTHNQRRHTALVPGRTYPVPTNIIWSLQLRSVAFPETPVAGAVHGSGFFCEKASLKGGALTFRQGRTWPPDLGLTVLLVAREGEDLAGKFIAIPPDRPPPLPKVILRWKDDQHEPATQTFESGYALKLSFGQPVDGKMPGRIYLCLPDDAKSVVAGVFEARIRPAQPPKENTTKAQ
jgi:DNA-directed RNA polymerase subunit RPC12/RpoP